MKKKIIVTIYPIEQKEIDYIKLMIDVFEKKLRGYAHLKVEDIDMKEETE